jgi:hypothetical protein
MSINFNDPRARSEFRDLRRDTFTVAEYEQSIKVLIRQILRYFWDDAEFMMVTTIGADAIFQVKMGEGKKPKKTINLSEAPSAMSMMQMMYGGGEQPIKSENMQAEWRFSAYLDLFKKLKTMYPQGPESVLDKSKDIINKYKKPLAGDSKVNKPEDSKPKILDWDEREFGTIPVPPGWDSVITRMRRPKTLPSEGELYPNHGDQIFEMKVHYDGTDEGLSDPDYEKAKLQVYRSFGCSDGERVKRFEREDSTLDVLSDAITAHDGCATLEERREVLDLLDKFTAYLTENPVKLTIRGEQYVLEKFQLTFQNVSGVDYWWIGFQEVAGIEAFMMVHEAEEICLIGETENVIVS